MTRRMALAALLIPAGFAQTSVRQEGGRWMAEYAGRLPAKDLLKVIAPGRIRVGPSRDDAVYYRWQTPLAALDEAEARRQAARLRVIAQPAGDSALVRAPQLEASGLSELTVNLPRGVRRLQMQSSAGSLWAEDVTCEIQAATSAGNVEMNKIRGNVAAKTGGGSMTFGRIEGSLRCLSGGGSIRAGVVRGEALLESAGGEIYIDEVGGPLRAAAVGNIHVGKAASTVAAHATGGLVEVESAGGLVTAGSTGGGITIGTAPAVRAESAAGLIRIKSVAGAVQASTGAGQVVVGLTGPRLVEDCMLSATRGDVLVFLPSKLAVTVRALSESGGWQTRLVSEFPEIQERLTEASARRPLLAEGDLNGGGPLLLLSAGNGTIQLRRRK